MALIACGSTERVIVAAGTTLVDSGVLELVAGEYERQTPGVRLSIVGEPTARVLELGANGSADVLVTHAPQAERLFLADHGAHRYELVMESRFVLVGDEDPVLADSSSIVEAFGSIASRGLTFVTRDDGSGTHLAELAVWEATGLDPTGADWYLSTGQGMGATLQVSAVRQGFTLAELGAFLSAEEQLGTEIVFQDAFDPLLHNPYHATVPTLARQRKEATRFVDWLISAEGRLVIERASRTLFGEIPVYVAPSR